MAPPTPVNGLDTTNDMRNSLYGMTGNNQDTNRPRTRQEGFNVTYPGLDGNRISQSFFNNVFQTNAERPGSQNQGPATNENDNLDAGLGDYNLQRALAQHMQNLAESAAQMPNNHGQGRDTMNEMQNSSLIQGGSAMSPDDLSKFVARNITPQDLSVGQIAVEETTPTAFVNSSNETSSNSLTQALEAHFENNPESHVLDNILSPEYWAAYASTPYQHVDTGTSNQVMNEQIVERQQSQQRNNMSYNNQPLQEQDEQANNMSHDPHRLFQQLAASFAPTSQDSSRLWSNASDNNQYLQLQEQQNSQRGRTGASARSIPAQTLAQCLLPSFSPLEKSGNNFDYEFSRLDMTGRGAVNPLGNGRQAAASATTSAAIMNMDHNYRNMNGMNGINPTFIDPTGASNASLNPTALGSSIFNQQQDMRNGYATNGVFEHSTGTPRTGTSMLSTRSPSTGSGHDVEMKAPSTSTGDGNSNEAESYRASDSGINPAHLQRPRSPSATRAGGHKSSNRRSASNNRQRSGTGDGIGPARRPSFNSHTVARTAAMQGSYPHPHEPPVSASSVNGGRPSHRRSSSSTNQIQTLASGVNTLGIEKDSEWLHLAGIDSGTLTSPRSANMATLNVAEGALSKSPTSTNSPGSGTMLRSPVKGKARTLSTSETTTAGSRPSIRRKSSTSRNRRGSRTQAAVKKEDLYDGEDSVLMDADEVAVSDGEHEDNIELTAEEMSKMTDAQIAAEKRRRAHNLVERHRREAINKGFVELEGLLSSSDIARKFLEESRIKGGEDDEDVDLATSSRRGKKSKKNTKKTSGGGMCKETILQSAIVTLQQVSTVSCCGDCIFADLNVLVCLVLFPENNDA
ncbi:hypothetical protein QFC19_009285 [Naganishia cerealis]|uniref:Uncharacterized protein n=1 Tax=Naganishia cerealis TaxID=610337 RepID=A0ACC2UW30_9TREE|nr:hypothetical protein QFC19_009285 [Naganishia cerealis]